MVNICLWNGLLCNATKSLLESVLTLGKCCRKCWSYLSLNKCRGLIIYPLRLSDAYMHASVIKAIIGSDNGFLPDRHQAIAWTNDILSTGPWRTHFNDILFEIQKFSFKKRNLLTSSAKWRPFCPSLNVLMVMAYSTAEWNDQSEFNSFVFY